MQDVYTDSKYETFECGSKEAHRMYATLTHTHTKTLDEKSMIERTVDISKKHISKARPDTLHTHFSSCT